MPSLSSPNYTAHTFWSSFSIIYILKVPQANLTLFNYIACPPCCHIHLLKAHAFLKNQLRKLFMTTIFSHLTECDLFLFKHPKSSVVLSPVPFYVSLIYITAVHIPVLLLMTVYYMRAGILICS